MHAVPACSLICSLGPLLDHCTRGTFQLPQTQANAELLCRSGLDSTTAMHLLTSLRALAKGGRSIITTIHQPSSRLYQQLDKLLLLSKVSADLTAISVVDSGVWWSGRHEFVQRQAAWCLC